MNNKEKIKSTLLSKTLFRAFRPEKLDDLIQQASMKKVDKGQLLFVSQESADIFYLIHSGWIKLFRETIDGAQAIIDILPMDSLFGESSIFENNTYPYSAEAVETSALISLPLSALKQEITENQNVALEMLSIMARYRKQQNIELEHLTIQNAPQRIGCFLLRLTRRDIKGPVTIHLPYDKTLVASRLGMKPETFSRALRKLKTATGMTVKGATIELDDIQKLIDFSCVACSSNFPCVDLSPEKTDT